MGNSLEERFNEIDALELPALEKFERKLTSLLETDSSCYQLPAVPVFPHETEILPLDGISSMVPVLKKIFCLGKFFSTLYKIKLKEMFWKFYQPAFSKAGVGTAGIEDGMAYWEDARSYQEIGLFVFQLIQQRKINAYNLLEAGRVKSIQDNILHELQKVRVIPEAVAPADEAAFRQYIELSGAYDNFVLDNLNPSLSDYGRVLVKTQREVQKGTIDEIHRAESNYQLLLPDNTMITDRSEVVISSQWDPRKDYDYDDHSLELARKTIRVIQDIVTIGLRETTHTRDLIGTGQHLEELNSGVAPELVRIGFNQNWEDNYNTMIEGGCIFNFKGDRNKPFKKGKKALFSLLYSLDPKTQLLFFSAGKEDNLAQAVAILFQAEDPFNHQEYIDLEGILMNEKFSSCRLAHPPLQKTPPFYLEQPELDLILFGVMHYALYLKKPLFINGTHVTTTEESGPHELLHYLSRPFPDWFYHSELISPSSISGAPGLDSASQSSSHGFKRYVVTGKGNKELYLEKDNEHLRRILTQNGITIPPELLSSDGRLCLYNHTFCNPRDRNTWINPGQSWAFGRIFSLEEMRNYLQR